MIWRILALCIMEVKALTMKSRVQYQTRKAKEHETLSLDSLFFRLLSSLNFSFHPTKALNLSSFRILSKSLSSLANSLYFLSISIAFSKSDIPSSISPFLTFEHALLYQASALFGFRSMALSKH
jgi:hypothetical protein